MDGYYTALMQYQLLKTQQEKPKPKEINNRKVVSS